MERVPPVDLFESDMRARLELGSPAYRIANNRSGLGYIETQAEMARMQATMVSRLFTRRLHVTSEPTALVAMILLGLLWGVVPLGLIVIGWLADRRVPLIPLLVGGGLNLLIGLFAFLSAVKSIACLARRRRKPNPAPIEP
jgi:hypothetical protein